MPPLTKRDGNTSLPRRQHLFYNAMFLTWMPLPRKLPREALHYVYQLSVHGAARIAQFGSRVLVCKSAQAQQLAQTLSPIELQIRRSAGEQEPPHFARAEKMAEFRCCHIDQESPRIHREMAANRCHEKVVIR